jgi:hypothetical protein
VLALFPEGTDLFGAYGIGLGVGYFGCLLVEDIRAAGVIGTEITTFESTAQAFAETCLDGYLRRRLAIGEAVRQTRIALLTKASRMIGMEDRVPMTYIDLAIGQTRRSR